MSEDSFCLFGRSEKCVIERCTIFQCVNRKCHECLFLYLKVKKYNPNICDIDGNSLLHYSVYKNWLFGCYFLIQNGSFIDKQNSSGNTPLNVSILCNNFEIFVLLVEKGSNISLQNILGQTPLHYICLGSMTKYLKYLISEKKELPINLKNNLGDTPLHCCAKVKFYEAFYLLVDLGANSKLKNNEDVKAFQILYSIPKKL